MATAASVSEEREFAFSESEFRFIAGLAYDRTGIVLAEHKRDMVYSRLARRLRALKLRSFYEYCSLLQQKEGEGEIGHLVNALTTNLTSFFREDHHFEHLKNEVLLPMKESGERRIRIWSAACSSGMEPYSIAMTIRQALGSLNGWDARILATDIDTNMLRSGIEGEYAAEEYDNIPANCRSGVQLVKSRESMTMPEDLKRMIAFKPLNLLDHWPMKGPFDAIFCRNVVIYFDKPTQKKLFARMAEIIKPGGMLYIGHSENLHNITDRFKLLGRTSYRRVA